jgi:hypothetical protein
MVREYHPIAGCSSWQDSGKQVSHIKRIKPMKDEMINVELPRKTWEAALRAIEKAVVSQSRMLKDLRENEAMREELIMSLIKDGVFDGFANEAKIPPEMMASIVSHAFKFGMMDELARMIMENKWVDAIAAIKTQLEK